MVSSEHDNLLARFELVTNSWSAPKTTGKTPSPRQDYAVAKIADQVFIYGGFNGEDRLNDMQVGMHIRCAFKAKDLRANP